MAPQLIEKRLITRSQVDLFSLSLSETDKRFPLLCGAHEQQTVDQRIGQ